MSVSFLFLSEVTLSDKTAVRQEEIDYWLSYENPNALHVFFNPKNKMQVLSHGPKLKNTQLKMLTV